MANVAFIMGISGALIFLAVAIAIGLLIFKARDVYRIKIEISMLAFIWFIVVISFLIYSQGPRPQQRRFPSAFILIIAYFFSLFVCNGLPLIYAYRFDKKNSGTRGGPAHFVALLQSIEFRNIFHDFLTRQFCQENLQFYEIVTEWKSLPHNDPEKLLKAKSIVDAFIVENGLCQVNISASVRDTLMEKTKMEEIPNDTFDEALNAILELMYENSYQQYVRNMQRGILSGRGESGIIMDDLNSVSSRESTSSLSPLV